MQAVVADDTPYPRLFAPLDIGGVPLRNRIAHASIVTRFVKDGRATPRLVDYLANRARGGAALLVTEPIAMHAGNPDPGRLRAFDDAELDSLRAVVQAVEREDSRLLGQLQDPGRGRHTGGRNDYAIGASALPDDLSWTVPHVLATGEITRLVAEWASAAMRLKQAGFSGVEISAGHGHLFHQFLSPWSNRRTDAYGGDLAGRTHLLREVIAALRAECGRPFIIGIKLPGDDGVPGSLDLAEARRIAAAIAATGEVDYWTFVWGAHARSLYTHLPNAHGPRAPYLGQIRELRAAGPGIVTGAIGFIADPAEAERALGDGTADLVFLGRPLITDPAWGEKARTGRPSRIRYCVACNTCWRTVVEGSRLECDNNPRVGEPDEASPQTKRAARPRRIVVVGAGIAGLEAACVAAARGHEVTVFGASAEVGGKTRLHATLPGGENLSSIYDYQFVAARHHGVTFQLGARAGLEEILSLAPDAVILATGSHPRAPDWLPAEYRDAGFVPDLRSLVAGLRPRTAPESGRIVIVDEDHTDMTYAAAERLTRQFAGVTILTPRERIASDCSLINRQEIYRRLSDRRVAIVASHELRGVAGLEDGRLTAQNVFNGDPLLLDDVVALTYASARVPDDELLEPLRARGCEVIPVGDCHAPRSVLAATRQGYQAALAL